MRINPVSICKEFEIPDGYTIFLSFSITFSKRFKNSYLTVEKTGAEVKYFSQSWNMLVWKFIYIYFFLICLLWFLRITAGLLP